MRVVSLCPSNTDTVLALDLEHLLVGVDRWSLGDAAVKNRLEAQGGVTDVGTDLHVDIEAVAALKPDVILASLSVPGMEKNIEALELLGLPHIVVDGHTLPGVRRGIEQIAAALNAQETGEAVLASLDADIADVRTKAAAARAQAVAEGREHELPQVAAWEWWPKPVIVAGRNSWIHDFFELLGVKNAFADLDKESSPVETDDFVDRQPDTLCASWCGTLESTMALHKIAARPGCANLPAVQTQRVFLLPEKLYGRPGPHLGKGLQELYELFYGDREAAKQRAAAAAGLVNGAYGG